MYLDQSTYETVLWPVFLAFHTLTRSSQIYVFYALFSALFFISLLLKTLKIVLPFLWKIMNEISSFFWVFTLCSLSRTLLVSLVWLAPNERLILVGPVRHIRQLNEFASLSDLWVISGDIQAPRQYHWVIPQPFVSSYNPSVLFGVHISSYRSSDQI